MKKAILLVCFGNRNIEEQIEKLITTLKQKFDYNIYICFTSKFFKKNSKYDIDKIFNTLYVKKYDEILCLPMFILDGIEYNNFLAYVNNYKNNFKKVKVAKPLLYDDNDFNFIYNFIKNNYKENLIYICHGTDCENNYKYEKLFNMFKNENIFFSNLESYPYIEDTIKILKEKNINKIYLKPFLLFSGKHIKQDISIYIKNKIIENNIKVELDLKPLLQYDEIINIFLNHLIEGIKGKEI